MNPIGYLKSPFKFKNGTPRQPSICQHARGSLTIEKSVFNNPEHSLEGLDNYSYLWLIFEFHKNNNSYSKAKVKPPRLNGKRVGLFSTRSPYRPNPIGLTLARIDKVDGSTVHMSGIDILDGTPILDIKPYIPQYDCPTFWSQPQDNQTGDTAQGDAKMDSHVTRKASASDASSFPMKSLQANHANQQGENICDMPAQISCFPGLSYNIDSVGNSSIDSQHTFQHLHKNNCIENFENRSSVSVDNVSVSQCSQSKETTVTCSTLPTADHLCQDLNVVDIPVKTNSDIDNTVCSKCNTGFQGPSSDHLCVNHKCLPGSTSAWGVVEKHEQFPYHSSETLDDIDRELNKDSGGNGKEKVMDSFNLPSDTGIKDVTAVPDIATSDAKTAEWVLKPPVNKLNVRFTSTALHQLEQFTLDSTDVTYRLQHIRSMEEARTAIIHILQEDPRSTYRRKHCTDSLYYFAVDVIHVTSWFDVNLAEVVRIKPASLVDQCKDSYSI